MKFSIWRLGFRRDGQKYAVGCVIYLNTIHMGSGSLRRGGAWTHLGWGFWWRKKKRKQHLKMVRKNEML